MTNNEIIKQLESLLSHCKSMIEKDGGFPIWEKDCEALEAAIAALLPVSREQVEKVWRGEWIGDNDEKVGTIEGSPIKSSTCSACGNWLVGSDEYDCAGYFCPACGAPMTDEAVEMVMGRLEEMKNG